MSMTEKEELCSPAISLKILPCAVVVVVWPGERYKKPNTESTNTFRSVVSVLTVCLVVGYYVERDRDGSSRIVPSGGERGEINKQHVRRRLVCTSKAIEQEEEEEKIKREREGSIYIYIRSQFSIADGVTRDF